MPCDKKSRPTTLPLPTAARDAEASCRLYVSLIPPAPFPTRNEDITTLGNSAPCGDIFSEIEFLTMFQLVLWQRKPCGALDQTILKS